MKNTTFPNTIIHRNKLYVKSTDKKPLFEEKVVLINNQWYREWDPRRSKLAAAIMLGMQNPGIKTNSKILYLGASHGYTPSFISDMIGRGGIIWAIDFSPRVMIDLYFNSEEKENIVPIMGDANKPEEYLPLITTVDVLSQDIAQKEQLEIMMKNAELFLKEGGIAILALKARSVDVTRKPGEIFQRVKKEINNNPRFNLGDFRRIDQYEKDHAVLVIKKK